MLVVLLVSHLSLSAAVQSGIFGGKKAKAHSRPYMASLQTGRDHRCGGVLIRDDYVLTAAHCYNRSDPIQVVVLGAHNIDKKEKSQQRLSISEFIPHPEYGKITESEEYDIMLLKLLQKARLEKKRVQVLELPREEVRIPAGQQCEVAGWGRRKSGKGSTDVLYEATVTLQEPHECQRAWRVYYNQEKMTCSKSNGKQGFCQGDSGGPLMCGKGKAKVLYGLMSYTAMPCNNKQYPEVYTRVSFFLPWIRKVLGVNDALETRS